MQLDQAFVPGLVLAQNADLARGDLVGLVVLLPAAKKARMSSTKVQPGR